MMTKIPLLKKQITNFTEQDNFQDFSYKGTIMMLIDMN